MAERREHEMVNLVVAAAQRLLGDAAIEARARAVLDDRMAHLALEFAVLVDPGDEDSRADLAFLDAH